ncbi:metallophosphoesterase family protein [Candidatus Laterigemmans baculatus]|uniref:metallophosphoesterase family protein n=1 Tax=Candidatus Laterigemmans baculatus TaxID=2770505 RepID=UPI0013DA05D6|nr:metallophosphoesterase family protein [Candidatus Laterigemmans baculatus]
MTKRAILSDIHGNLTALNAVLADLEHEGVESIVCLGDVVGYGPEPCACLDRAMEFEFSILGNHDNSALFDPEGFNAAAEQAIFWTRRQLETKDSPEDSLRRLEFISQMPRTRLLDETLLFVHGSPRGPTNEYVFPEDTYNRRKMDKLFSLVPGACFQGHTHVPGVFTADLQFLRPADIGDRYEISDQKIMVNVGSVGQPRDNDPRSCYVILEGNELRFRRVEYDIESTVAAIEAIPELDNFLGYRLREGH